MLVIVTYKVFDDFIRSVLEVLVAHIAPTSAGTDTEVSIFLKRHSILTTNGCHILARHAILDLSCLSQYLY